MTELYVAPRSGLGGGKRSLSSRYQGTKEESGSQVCCAATPDAKDMSQTGRAYDCARDGPYTRTAARPSARAIDTQCLASDGRPFTACWRWVSATPGFFSCSSSRSLSRRTSCGARETARVETSD